MRFRPIGPIALSVLALTACSEDDPVFIDACSPGEVTAAVTTPTAYACMEPFRAAVRVTNQTCSTITVNNVMITGVVTAGACGPPGPSNYPPAATRIAPGATVEVLDLTANAFCCRAPGCPATLMCSEAYTFAVDTTAGVVTATANAELDLGGCNQICP